MSNIVFNIAKGRVVEYYNRVKSNDPANSALILIPIETSGLEADAVLIDVDTKTTPVLLLNLLRNFSSRLRQIANVSEARLYPVFTSEEAAQRLCFRGRLDDDKRFSHYETEITFKTNSH